MLSGTVLVPGITIVASAVFVPLVKQLELIGVAGFTPLDIPSVNPTKPLLPNAFEADVADIRAALAEAIESKGLDVVFLGHSYGAAPCLTAAEVSGRLFGKSKGRKAVWSKLP
jgi:hypothetical protein